METPEVRGLSIFLNAQIDEKGMKNALMAMEKHSERKVNKWEVTSQLKSGLWSSLIDPDIFICYVPSRKPSIYVIMEV